MSSSPASGAPAHIRVMELCSSAWLAASVSAVADLGIADELVSGPRSVDDLADAVGAHADRLYRLMRACADLDVFEELPDRTFALADVGRSLVTGAPNSMRHFAAWMGDRAELYTWAHLADAVRTGESAFEAVHRQPAWEYLEERPAISHTFDLAMTEISSLITPLVVDTYDFSTAEVVVDVGGGHGTFLAGILAANEDVRGVLYDRPGVIAGAERTLERAGVLDRCELVPGSFLESVPAGGDCYTISNTLRNWDDAAAERILTNCRKAMSTDGRLIVIETIMPSNADPSPAKMLDLDMMLLCSGRQRTEGELDDLFGLAGLRLSKVQHTGIGISAVEAVPL